MGRGYKIDLENRVRTAYLQTQSRIMSLQLELGIYLGPSPWEMAPWDRLLWIHHCLMADCISSPPGGRADIPIFTDQCTEPSMDKCQVTIAEQWQSHNQNPGLLILSPRTSKVEGTQCLEELGDLVLSSKGSLEKRTNSIDRQIDRQIYHKKLGHTITRLKSPKTCHQQGGDPRELMFRSKGLRTRMTDDVNATLSTQTPEEPVLQFKSEGQNRLMSQLKHLSRSSLLFIAQGRGHGSLLVYSGLQVTG